MCGRYRPYSLSLRNRRDPSTLLQDALDRCRHGGLAHHRVLNSPTVGANLTPGRPCDSEGIGIADALAINDGWRTSR